jgi:hypothetical protein
LQSIQPAELKDYDLVGLRVDYTEWLRNDIENLATIIEN